MPRKEAEHRINNFIRASTVRLVGENVPMGVYPLADALKIAQQLELDLVEISPQVDPPVCKVVEYNKFLYDKKRKEKEMKAKSKSAELKEIRFISFSNLFIIYFLVVYVIVCEWVCRITLS